MWLFRQELSASRRNLSLRLRLLSAAGLACCALLLLFERQAAGAAFQAGRWLALGGIGVNYLGWALLKGRVLHV